MSHIRNHEPSSWRIALVLFFITSFIESMSMSHVFAFMPVYLERLNVPHVQTWVGILSAVTFVVGLPLVPLWGIWAQRFGGKAVIIRSAYVEMVVFAVLGWSHSLIGIFFAMMLVGFQLGNTGVMLSALRSATPDGRIGFAVSVFSVSGTVGMAGGPLIGGILTAANLLDLHGLYILDGVLSLLTGTMLMFFYRQPRVVQPETMEERQTRSESAWNAAWKSVRYTFSLPITWTLFGVYTVLMMGRQMAWPYLPVVIEELPIHGVSVTFAIGGLMGLTAVVGALITIFTGRLGDKMGFVRTLMAAFILSLPAVLAVGFVHNLGGFVLALTLYSAGYSIGSAMIFALFSTRIPETHRSTALNLVYLPLYVGGIVGPATASGLAQIGLFGPFAGAAVMCAVGLVLIVVVLSRQTRPSKGPSPVSVSG